MSDDNIVTFEGKKPEPAKDEEEYIIVCTRCDNRTFNLYAGGRITCGFCDTDVVSADDADTRAWARVVGDVDPARKDEIPDADLATRTTTQRHHMSAPSFARKQTIKLLSEWERGDKLVMLVGYNAAGEGRHWFNIVNEPQREWVLEKFEMLHHTLTTMDITAAVSETINPRSESRKMPSDED